MRISVAHAAQLLQAGEVVAIPTETVYGLAADACNEAALLKIFHTKARPQTNPLIVHLAHGDEVSAWASAFPPLAMQFAAQFWPGPLTLVLPARPSVSPIIRAGEPTVALRVPAHPIARQLITSLGRGLAAPSANKYTQLSPTTAEHVLTGLGESIPVVDGGACEIGIESTIVSVDDAGWQLLRPGMISEAALTACAGFGQQPHLTQRPKAPGQHLLHYSPRTPCRLFNDMMSLERHAASHTNVAVLTIGTDVSFAIAAKRVLPLQADKAAETLYADLHALDALNCAEILIMLPPNSPEWAAIRDRLMRAAYLPHVPQALS